MDDFERRRFRFGFAGGAAPLTAPDGWRSLEAAGLHWALHPDCQITAVRTEGGEALLLGSAFSLDDAAVETHVRAVLETPGDLRALDQLSGRWVLVIKTPEHHFAAHDAFGARAVYYAVRQRAIASHVGLLAAVCGLERRHDVTAFMEMAEYRTRSVRYLPGDLTCFTDAYALTPNVALDLAAMRTWRYWPRAQVAAETREDFYAALDGYFAAYAKHLRGGAGRVLIGVTAGVDTRAILAAARAQDLPFTGITWQTGVPDKDWPVINEVAALCGAPHAVLERDATMGALSRLAGENGGPQRGPNRIAATLGAFAEWEDVFILGHGGEVMRGFYNISRSAAPMPVPSPEAMTICYNSSLREAEPTPEYTRFCCEAFAAFAARAEYEKTLGLGLDLRDVFYWEHRMGTWSPAFLNEADAGVHTIVGYNSRQIFETAYGLPPNQRITKSLLSGYIARHNEALAALPYY